MRQLSLLLQLSDSALPTGGFSHSFGFEQYIQSGEIHDADTFAAWLRMYVAQQLTHTDALLLRMLYEGVSECELADRAVAITLPAQVRAADVAIAKRIRSIGEDALGVLPGDVEVAHPAIEFGRIARTFQIPLDDAVTGHLTGTTSTLVQNAVRGIPIGQAAGQRLLATAHGWIEQAGADVYRLAFSDLGMTAPGMEIAQMQHERLQVRMFMS